MHDRTVQRRRLVFAAAVIGLVVIVVSVAGGPAVDIRRGADQVFSPIGDGASRATRPVSNLFTWIGDTVSAKGSVSEARDQRDTWRDTAIRNAVAASENRQLRGLSELDQEPYSLQPYGLVTARVAARSPASWYERVIIDKGLSSGIRDDMPVIAADDEGADHRGLIGKTSSVTATSAVVTLMAHSSMAVGAKIVGADADEAEGLVSPSINRARDIVLTGIRAGDHVEPGALVATQGTLSQRNALTSIYPPDLPIGRITRIDDPDTLNEVPHLRLFVDTRRIRYVQVLTKQVNGNR